MPNPKGRMVLDEAEACAIEQRYAVLEAQLQALHQQNEELTRAL